ncbi:carotenoid oxygenase family protein [Streptomyces sp. OR43]|uniref:carotenoid oxygenase family protein n=1 Tax=Streptomyces sp. or43 TaxID=2478957 RepID=UPI0011CDA4D6|nr:carotenoid oxygenase family protein [Streptomyces sp. or43]TXS48322.1 carotenoid oxygenase family protein [Streptomyces sp. or43]
MAAHAQQAFDPARVVHLSGRFAPVTDEVDEARLQVTGELPDELDGLFLRNGPNPRFSPIGSFLYPIDGDGMLHGVWISGGQARYRNRFVRTPAVLAEERAGRALWGGIESMIMPQVPDVEPELAGTFRDLPDINVVRHAGRLLALAESDCPFLITPDLGTAGKETFGGALPAGITAHPKTDPLTGEMLVFCYALEPPYLTWSAIAPDGSVARGPTPVDGLDEPMMIHDTALTARFLVIVLAPVFFDIAAAMNGGSMIDWRPERGTRVALVPRHGGPVRWASDDAFWLWHTVNAYDTGPEGDVVLDYVQWSRLSLGAPDPAQAPNTAGLVRAVIDPVAGTMHRTVLDDARMELPRTDDRLIGRRHQQLAVASDSGNPDLLPGEFDTLRWYDGRDASGTSTVWRAGNLSVGEPVFAPSPGTAPGEGGHWMTYATDRTDDTSWLLVIPAEDPASGPVARVRIPVRVPLGLHGNWLPTQE